MPDLPKNELTVVTPYPGKSPHIVGEAEALMKQAGGLRSFHMVTNGGDIVATLDVWYGPSRHVFMVLWDAEGCRIGEHEIPYEELQSRETAGLREQCEGILEKKMTEMLERNGLQFITSLV